MMANTSDTIKPTYVHEESVHFDHIVQNFQLLAKDHDQ